MVGLNGLVAAYTQLLGAGVPAVNHMQASDAFEVYTLGLALRAAREEGATVSFESTDGTHSPRVLCFRSGPGSIYSARHDYTHAVIEFSVGLEFEVHLGIYVQGRAGVLHECDVCTIERSEGKFCRRHRVHPKSSAAVLTAECKFYTGKIGIALGREFLGVTADLGAEGRFFISNSDGRSVDRVLAHHKRRRFFKLEPGNPDGEGQAVSQFRAIFRDLIARRR